MATATLSGHDQVRDGYVGGTGLAVGTWPADGTTAVLTPSGTTSNAAIPAQATVGPAGTYRFATDTAVHVNFGTSDSVTATTSNPLVPVGVEYMIIDPTMTHIAVITAA